MPRRPKDDTPAALIEDLEFLADVGVGASEAARRTGFTNAKSLDTYLRRRNRVDLMQRLAAQDYQPMTNRGPTRNLGRAS